MSDEPFLVAHPRLVPVVELEPSRYATREHEVPARRDDEERYWRESLADAGLSLEPLRPGSWLVPVRLVDERALRAIFEVHTRDQFEDGPPTTLEALTDELGPLRGGVALLDGDRVVLEPGCCADLGDLSEWQKITTRDSPAWELFWTGHPLTESRAEGDRVLIRLENEVRVLAVDGAALRDSVELAEAERRAFAARLAPIVRDWLGNDAWLDEALALLVGLAR